MKKIITIIALAVLLFAACTPQDAVYKDLYQQAYKTDYPQVPTDLSGAPGYLSAYLSWIAPVSPTCTEAVIYWNFKKDSLRINLWDPQYNFSDTIRVRIDNLDETDYTFDVYTIDRAGNRSVVSEILVSPKGDNYVRNLAKRTVSNSIVSEINEAGVVNWGDIVKISPYSEIRYQDSTKVEKTLTVPASEKMTVVKDIDFINPGVFEYRSVLVTSDCLDTLYSEWVKQSWYVDPDYAKDLPAGTQCLGFKARKSGTVTQDTKDSNQYLFNCTGSDFSAFVNALTQPVTKSVLVYQYKQTHKSNSVKAYWINSGGSVDSKRYSSIVLNTHNYGIDEWSVAVINMSDYWKTHSWSGNIGDYARLDFNTTAGNSITIRNAHFRDKREGE